MPGTSQYPKDRVAQPSHESGQVKSGLPTAKIEGKETVKAGRAGGK